MLVAWFLGPTISHSALYAELQRRKATVDDSKARERAEKAGKIVGADGVPLEGQQGLLERGDVSMTRGEGPAIVIDSASESLPPVVPSITAFAKGAVAGATLGAPETINQSSGASAAAAQNAAAVMDGSAFAAGGEGGESYSGSDDAWGTPGEAAAAPAKTEQDASSSSAASAAASSSAEPTAPVFPASASLLQSFTRFSCSRFGSSAGKLFDALQDVFGGRELGFQIEQAQRSKAKFKSVKCVTGQGVILFSATIYTDPVKKDTLIVDFKKRGATDGAQFRTLFAEMRFKCRQHGLVDEVQSEALQTPQQPVPQQQAGQ
jgi:hypothetical protein